MFYRRVIKISNMKRGEIIKGLKKYFKITELVCPHTYKRYGDMSWMFLDTEALHTLLVLREDILQVPLICNSYSIGLTQRGLRCNLCELIKEKTENDELSLTAHGNGKAWDLTSPKMTADEMRRKISQKSHLLPYPVRIEKGVKWLHVDNYDIGNSQKITYF